MADLNEFSTQEILNRVFDKTNNRLSIGGNVRFPAAQVSSTDANTLDDYEEGSWTPAISFSTSNGDLSHTGQVGRYVKIGKMVFFQCWLRFAETTANGTVTITGLPFTSEDTVDVASAGGGYTVNLTGMTDGLVWLYSRNATTIALYYSNDGSATNVAAANTGASNQVVFSGSYRASA